MNDKQAEGLGPAGHAPEDDVLAALFDSAQARERPAPGIEERVRGAVKAEWNRIRLRRQRFRRSLALAASVILGAILVLQWTGQDSAFIAPVPLATVIHVSGDVSSEGDDARAVRSGEILRAGDVIDTGSAAGTSLEWQNGVALRIGERSRLRLRSLSEVELLQGRIYLDTRATPDTPGEGLTLKTPVGEVTHIGTQYLAVLFAGELAVTVREGRVRVHTSGSGTAEFVGRGERIRLPALGPATMENAPTYGAQWAWVEALAPPYQLEGSSAWDFLQWIGRETGRAVTFVDATSEQAARNATLHGSIDVPPMDALRLVLPTTDLEAVVQDRQIVVSLRR